MEFIAQIITTSLFIVGLHWSTHYETHRVDVGDNYFRIERNKDESNILWFLRYYPHRWFPSFIYKPIIGCVQCMGSIWGVPIYFWTHPSITIESCVTCVVFVCAVSATNMVINKQIES
jgi:hypothetical protein